MHQHTTTLAFIVTDLPQWPDLANRLAGSMPGMALEVIAHDGFGLSHMAQRALHHPHATAVHVFSHGSPGQLHLGHDVLAPHTLAQHAPTLAALRQALPACTQWLWYGCNAAQGDTGAALVQALAHHLGASTQASTTPTGHASLGGDWLLQHQAAPAAAHGWGAAHPAAPLGPTLAAWPGLMAVNTAPTFSTAGTGKAIIPVGSSNDEAHSVIQQADGKLVLAGYSNNSGNTDYSIVRLNADGSLDSSFGTGGKLLIPVGDYLDQAYSVIQQADGKLVLAGYSNRVGDNDYSIVRLNADGTLDTDFGTGGKLLIAVSSLTDIAYDVIQQTDGKLVLVGNSNTYNGSDSDFSIIRLNADGTLDTSFGTGGKSIIPVGSTWDYARSVIQQSDGKLLVAGYSLLGVSNSFDMTVVRLHPNGLLDSSFSDPVFRIPGKVFLPRFENDAALSVIQQSDGKVVLAGYNQNGSSYDFSAVRLNLDGSMDLGFGNGGKVTIPVGSASDYAFSIIQQADGKLVIAGISNNGSNDDFSIVRLTTDGSLDTSFGIGGKSLIPVGTSTDYAHSVIQQADGKLVLAGYSYNGGNNDFSIIRLNPDGRLDTTFNATNTLNGVANFTEGGAPVVLDDSVAVFDAELAALNGGAGSYLASLTVARQGGANGQDLLSIDLTGASFTIRGSGNLQSGGKDFAGFISEGGELSIVFLQNNGTPATQALVNEVLSRIAYANSSDAPPANVTLEWRFSDMNDGNQGTGGRLIATGSTTVNITAVNDTPVIVGLPASAQSVTVGTAAALADFTVTDPDGANVPLTVTLVTNNGTLVNLTDADTSTLGIQLRGTAAQINAAIAAATFTATAAGASSIGVSVSDGVSAATTGSYSLNVLPAAITSASASPVLDASKSPALVGMAANAAVPTNGSTAGATLVSALIGTTGIANYSDANSDPAGLAITGVNTTSGTLYFSTNAGATWTATGAVSATSARVLVADANTYVYYQPNAGYSGTVSDAITLKAWDQTGGYINGQAGVDTVQWRPVLKGTYDTSGDAIDVVISGNHAYVADQRSGLQVIDISNPASPRLVGTYDTSGVATDVAVSGNHAYVADSAIGLQVIDISNPASPRLVSTYDTSDRALGVAISGNHAYVADGFSGLQVIDISNPAIPRLVGTYETSGAARDVAISGNHAYVADEINGLEVIDISNPAIPRLVGTYDTSGTAIDVAISGNHAYVADHASGLQVIDISNPASPRLVGTYDTAGFALGVAISGNHAYVADGGSGLQVIDISNPASPALVGTYDTSGFAFGVVISGNRAYVADFAGGLQVIDITAPAFSSASDTASVAVPVDALPTPTPTPIGTVPVVISADKPDFEVGEGATALAKFKLSGALSHASVVSISHEGWGAVVGQDFDAALVVKDHTGATLSMTANGEVTLPVGTQWFTVQTAVKTDGVTHEAGEAISFIVQAKDSAGIKDSWWVNSVATIIDQTGGGSSVTPVNIVALASSFSVNEGATANATFQIKSSDGNPAVLGAASDVFVTISGWGAQDGPGADYIKPSTAAVMVNGVVQSVAIAANGKLTLPKDTQSFVLSAAVLADSITPEMGEAINFEITRAADANALSSWWVSSVANIVDQTVTDTSTTPVVPVRISAAQETFSVNEGQAAQASFSLSAALSAQSTVKVGIEGWGASGTDFSAHTKAYVFKSGVTTATETVIAADGTLVLPVGTISLTLKAEVLADNLIGEVGEQINFSVAQIANESPGLAESWWVNSIANLVDGTATGTGSGPTVIPRTINTIDSATVVEGNEAIATFTLDGALQAQAQVRTAVYGWGSEEGKDFAGLYFRPGDNGTWQSVANLGVLTLSSGTEKFQLMTRTVSDGLQEFGESLAFVVAQQEYGAALQGSGWVQQVISLQDHTGASTGTVPGSVQATINAVKTSVSVKEGAYATAGYQLSKALNDAATVTASLLSISGTPGLDTTGPLQFRTYDPIAKTWSSFADVASDGQITLSAGVVRFELRTKTVLDRVTEIGGEDFYFLVNPASANLSNMALEGTTLTVNDADANLINVGGSAVGASISQSSSKQDVFDLTDAVGKSVGVAGQFYRLAFGEADIVKLPTNVVLDKHKHYDLTAGDELNSAVSGTNILSQWQGLNGTAYSALDASLGAGSWLTVRTGNYTYAVADTNGDGLINSGRTTTTPAANQDLFVRIIGQFGEGHLTADAFVIG